MHGSDLAAYYAGAARVAGCACVLFVVALFVLGVVLGRWVF